MPERPVPAGRWGLPWLCALVASIAACTAVELALRAHGYVPSVKDDAYLWAEQRALASDGSPRTMAILGASRIQLAWSASAAKTRLPGWHFANLAIDGTSPIGTLRDLAADPDFRGVALVDANEYQLAPRNWSSQDDFVATYHDRMLGAVLERKLETLVQSSLALDVGAGRRLLAGLLHGSVPAAPYVTTFADRTRYADFSKRDIDTVRAARVDRLKDVGPRAPGKWLRQVLEVDPFVDAIQARGGKVVFVRMPTCDERWANDEATMPKAVFWDAFAAATHATTIHFKDYPTLSDFACPDTSHIDSSDGPRFTSALLDVLVDRGVVVP